MREYTYVIELTQSHGQAQHLVFSTQNSVIAYSSIAQISADHVLIDIRKINANIDYGNLILFLNRDRAFVRLLEHRDFVAHEREQDVSYQIDIDCTFYDESSEPFHVALSDTISRHSALRALHYWLQHDQTSPELTWH